MTPFDIIMDQRHYNIRSNYEAAVSKGIINIGSVADAIKASIPKELERNY